MKKIPSLKKIQKEQSNSERTVEGMSVSLEEIQKEFPKLVSRKEMEELLRQGYTNFGGGYSGRGVYEYPRWSFVDTGKYKALALMFMKEFSDDYGTSWLQIIELVYKKLGGSEERTTKKEFWEVFTERRSGRVDKGDAPDYDGVSAVASKAKGNEIEIIISVAEDKRELIRFSADLEMGGELVVVER